MESLNKVTIDKSADKITFDNLMTIFELFGKAYDIDTAPKDIKYFEERGVEDLRSPGGLRYTPFLGATFAGKRYGQSTQFWGQRQLNDPKQGERDSKFEQLVLNYFNQIPSGVKE